MGREKNAGKKSLSKNSVAGNNLDSPSGFLFAICIIKILLFDFWLSFLPQIFYHSSIQFFILFHEEIRCRKNLWLKFSARGKLISSEYSGLILNPA